MMKSRLNTLVATMIGMVLLGGVTRAEATPITYAVALFDGPTQISVGGSITTDGTLGALTSANILDWNLIVTSLFSAVQPNPPGEHEILWFDLVGPLSGNNSSVDLTNVVATPLTLALTNPEPHGGSLQFTLDSGISDQIQVTFALFPSLLSDLRICDFLATVSICGDSSGAIPSTGIIGDGKEVPVPGPSSVLDCRA
jgi:hypothetical protein